MAKRKNTKYHQEEQEEEEQPIVKKVFTKPYIETLTADTKPRDVKADKLPEVIKVRYKQSPTGETSNRYLGKSGIRYDFNGRVPLPVINDVDKVAFVLKAIKNPETWEIVK